MEKLTLEEIFCLAKYGKTTPQIIKTDLAEFDRLYDENTDEFDKWLDYSEDLFDRQNDLGIKTISCQDTTYPSTLSSIGEDAPPLIHLLGNESLLSIADAVAIIGARAADRQGIDAAFRLGAKYASNEKVIVSGLALGCDKAAHEGCLSVKGKTIAIVASGLDTTHPKENVVLRHRIIENDGLLLSEQIIGVKANPTRLVARNRLQAAVSHTVILAQCPKQSGSLHTMRFARRYHKDCLAVDFPDFTDWNCGNHSLIENGLASPIKI